MKNCPLCGDPLAKQSLEDSPFPDIYCHKTVTVNGKLFNHYRMYLEGYDTLHSERIFILPYRIQTFHSKDLSEIGVLSNYKTGKQFFRKIAKVPVIHPDTEQNLRDRIKNLVLFI